MNQFLDLLKDEISKRKARGITEQLSASLQCLYDYEREFQKEPLNDSILNLALISNGLPPSEYKSPVERLKQWCDERDVYMFVDELNGLIHFLFPKPFAVTENTCHLV